MVSRSEYLSAVTSILTIILCLVIGSCVSFRVIKINNGVDIAAPAKKIIRGETTLADILLMYGAPNKIIDVEGKTVIVYEKSYYRGGQLSVGIPLSDIAGVSVNSTAFGNLLRYDTLLATFDENYIMTDIAYEKGTDYPFWTSLLKD